MPEADYYKTTEVITSCSCNGNFFPVYQQCDSEVCYNKFVYYSCSTGKWGYSVIGGILSNLQAFSRPTSFPAHTGLVTENTPWREEVEKNKQCPESSSATCSFSSLSFEPPSPPPPPSTGGTTGFGGCTEKKEEPKPEAVTLMLYGIAGLMTVMALVVTYLLVTSCGSKGKASDPKLTGKLSKEETLKQASWGPHGLLFPIVWLKIWFGYFAMLVMVTVVIPTITTRLNPVGGTTCTGGISQNLPTPPFRPGPWLEAIVALGPFVQLILMPVLWSHKQRQVKRKIMGEKEEAEEKNPLDPEAKTTIFGRKLPCLAKVLGLFIGSIDLSLRMIKTVSFGTINLQAFFFPAPFYDFYSAKLLIKFLQVDGRKLAITATQADSYMKFCTEQMLNFWTLGFYGRCCKGRTNYNRWLDRHLVWEGGTPPGYNNQFRVFDDILTCCQKLKMIGLNALGGCLSIIPILGALWPVAQFAQWYRYKLDLRNMKFGGSQPEFIKEFTACNYIYKYYTVGICGLCGMPLKRYVDTCIRLGAPKFDEAMAAEDKEADAGSPDDVPVAVEMQPSATAAPAAAVAEKV